MKSVVGSLKLELAQYNEMLAFAQFGSDLDENTKAILEHGAKVYELIKQDQYSPISQADQAVILIGVKERIINIVPKEWISEYRNQVIKYLQKDPDGKVIESNIINEGIISKENYAKLEQALVKICKSIVSSIPNYDASMHKSLPEKYLETKEVANV